MSERLPSSFETVLREKHGIAWSEKSSMYVLKPWENDKVTNKEFAGIANGDKLLGIMIAELLKKKVSLMINHNIDDTFMVVYDHDKLICADESSLLEAVTKAIRSVYNE